MSGVAIFVDLANIHLGLKNYYLELPPYDIVAGVINDYGAREGEVVSRRVYTDWNDSRLETLARRFAVKGFRAQQVTRKANGRDRTDLCLSLDALQLAYENNGIDTILLVAGDADYVEVLDRLRTRGKKVYILACEKSLSPELLPYVQGHASLESELQRIGITLIPLKPIFTLIWSLEEYHRTKGGFVGAGLFLRKGVDAGLFQPGDKSILNALFDKGFIIKGSVDNPRNPEFPTTSIALDRSNEVVRNFLRTKGGS